MSLDTLRREKSRLIADINRLRLDIATGKQPTIGQQLDRIILDQFNQTVIQ